MLQVLIPAHMLAPCSALSTQLTKSQSSSELHKVAAHPLPIMEAAESP